MKYSIRNSFRTMLMGLLFTATIGCKKFLELPPPRNSIVTGVVFSNNAGAIAAQDAVFMYMGNSNFGSYHTRLNLSADEWLYYGVEPAYVQLSKNIVTAENKESKSTWASAYGIILAANTVIEEVEGSAGITAPVKRQLIAEAKFCRAFQYFYLVNLFGDVALTTTTDYRKNAVLSRSPVKAVYGQIVSDLVDAKLSLSDSYLNGDLTAATSERLRPNKAAASALLARVYLFQGKWSEAEAEASAVINNQTYSLETDLDNIFLTTSKEAIWQLPPIDPSINTLEGYAYNNLVSSSSVQQSLNPTFLDVFEPGDSRKAKWIGIATKGTSLYYYPYKYKVQLSSSSPTEYETVFRLAELYLIRAEARAQQDNLFGQESAESDLAKVRNRAGLAGTTAASKQEMLDAVLHERQVELFAEFGHRWMDLKRTGKINKAMQDVAAAKKTTWNPQQALYPVPASDIQNNRNLLPNNPGY